jgi:hypothetical protein
MKLISGSFVSGASRVSLDASGDTADARLDARGTRSFAGERLKKRSFCWAKWPSRDQAARR